MSPLLNVKVHLDASAHELANWEDQFRVLQAKVNQETLPEVSTPGDTEDAELGRNSNPANAPAAGDDVDWFDQSSNPPAPAALLNRFGSILLASRQVAGQLTASPARMRAAAANPVVVTDDDSSSAEDTVIATPVATPALPPPTWPPRPPAAAAKVASQRAGHPSAANVPPFSTSSFRLAATHAPCSAGPFTSSLVAADNRHS